MEVAGMVIIIIPYRASYIFHITLLFEMKLLLAVSYLASFEYSSSTE